MRLRRVREFGVAGTTLRILTSLFEPIDGTAGRSLVDFPFCHGCDLSNSDVSTDSAKEDRWVCGTEGKSISGPGAEMT